ncbi:MAG: hypothetical protein QM493_05680 [Sulfurovum sp.]
MSKEINSINELKRAIKLGETEIISYDNDVVKKLKAVKLAKSWGPVAVGGIIIAIPLVLTTGPIVALIIVIGGVISISLFTDWEYVELPGGIKMKRKK